MENSASSNPYYEEWKKGATYSRQHQQKQADEQNYQQSAARFYGCTEKDMELKRQALEENKPADPKSLIKETFRLDKTQSQAPQNKYVDSIDHQTSNNFFHSMTNNSQNKLQETQHEINPVLEQLDPSTFEVSAKKYSQIWKTEQYNDEQQRQNLAQTTNRVNQGYDPEVADRVRATDHNIKVTNISEYSNALNRGRVFINPKFSSC